MKFRSLKYLTLEGLKNIWVNRLMSIASIGVLVACMVLMGAAILFSLNVDKALGSLQDQNVVMVYIKDGITKEETKQAYQDVKKLANVKEAVFIPREEGVDSLLKDMGDQYKDLFAWVDEDQSGSFLPDGIRVSFTDLTKYDDSIKQIKAVKNIENINSSRELTMQIIGMRKMITIAGAWIIGLLMITALVIIANTIKITMHNRKLEISIMKAVGATDNFIRFPFIVEGMVLGLISALVTSGLLYLAYEMTVKQITKVMTLEAIPYSSVFWGILGLFCLIGVATGCIGSVISIGKYLRKEGSEFRAF